MAAVYEQRGFIMDREKVIEVAVNWWADKIGNKYRHSNGDNSPASVMACLMADMSHKKPTPEQIDTFKSELKKRIEEEYAKIENREYGRIWLSCDYAPCKTLYEAAIIAGVNELNFPFKTNMCITKGEVTVSDGYCMPYVKIGE